VKRPVLAVSIGCPAGIGPDVAIRAAARLTGARCVLVGDHDTIRRAARRARVASWRLCGVGSRGQARRIPRGSIGLWEHGTSLSRPAVPGRPTERDGAATLAWIAQACDLVAVGTGDALVTGPVSKAVIAASGAPGARGFAGHTEYLAERLGAGEVVMAFHGRALATALVTTHLSLSAVPAAISAPRVARACTALAGLLTALGCRPPRVLVAALNPHAGEDGMFGQEERAAIVPGIVRARRQLARRGCRAILRGPVGAETAFRLAARGRCDGVVAMYHDQATIPCKLVGFGDMVNVTLCLPIVRTSVDHGTAYDLAGTGRPSSRSMAAAMALAARLARGGGTRPA